MAKGSKKRGREEGVFDVKTAKTRFEFLHSDGIHSVIRCKIFGVD